MKPIVRIVDVPKLRRLVKTLRRDMETLHGLNISAVLSIAGIIEEAIPPELPPMDAPPLTSMSVTVDETLPIGEVRVHPAAFDLLQRAFLEADVHRGFPQRLYGWPE